MSKLLGCLGILAGAVIGGGIGYAAYNVKSGSTNAVDNNTNEVYDDVETEDYDDVEYEVEEES